MRDATPGDVQPQEPLARAGDLDEYRAGLARRLSGEWDEDRWTGYRVRFGVYGQRQPGVQMVRIKVPGGVLPVRWLPVLADANRRFAQGDAHVTTRQDVQIYSVPLERSADLLETLYSAGITTREACGNTIRNLTSCALAGACPRERVDAGRVAEQLARSWIRHPLVQHMPRKVKISVSGCATDCGGTAFHDLGLVAVEKEGRVGFRVTAGGGLGAQPRAAVEVLDFVEERDLPRVVEALARIHQRHSDRRNRNAARIKFVLKRLGDDRFRALFRDEFLRLSGLAQRPWQGLRWRIPAEAEIGRTPVGILQAHDGSRVVVVPVPLGILSSDRLDGLHAAAVAAGVTELRTTRDQNLAFLGVEVDRVDGLVAALRDLGLDPEAPAADVISCPGTTTCRIGITNSQSLAAVIAERGGEGSVHLSGCQNSCGLHHLADFGLHGVAKKIDGRHAPHYQLHIGGDKRSGAVGLSGPIVPARLANEALDLLRAAAALRPAGESIRVWAERLGKDGLGRVLAPLDGADADGLFVDWGEASDFAGPPQARGECAAPFVADEVLASLAEDALIELDRLTAAGRWAGALQAAERATVLAACRLIHLRGRPTEDEDAAEAVYHALRSAWAGDGEIPQALEDVLAERGAALATGRIDSYREAVKWFLDTAHGRVEVPSAPVAAAVGDLATLLGGGE